MKNNKKGMFQQMGALAIGIVTLILVLSIGFLIMASIKTQIVATEVSSVGNSSAFNATNTLINAAATIPGWVPLIVIAVIGAMLLGLVKMFK